MIPPTNIRRCCRGSSYLVAFAFFRLGKRRQSEGRAKAGLDDSVVLGGHSFIYRQKTKIRVPLLKKIALVQHNMTVFAIQSQCRRKSTGLP